MRQILPAQIRNLLTISVACASTLVAHSGTADAVVYASTGVHGEAYFSDTASDNTKTLVVFVNQADPEEAARVLTRTENTLALATDLQDARLEREAQLRSQARRNIQVSRLEESQSRFDASRSHYPFYYAPYNRGTRVRPRVQTPDPAPSRRPFAPVFKPVAPALQN